MKVPKWLKDWGPTIALVLVVVFVFSRNTGAGDMKGKRPDFTLPSLAGGDLTLSSYQGKIRVVDFWATWCGPCKMMTPQFAELHRKYQDRGVVVIGVALDEPAAVRQYVEEHEVPYPIVLGDPAVAEHFGGIRGIPTTFIIDRQGRITNRHVGFRPVQVLEADIRGLL